MPKNTPQIFCDLRSPLDFAVHRTANIYWPGGLDLSRMLADRLRRRARNSRPKTGSRSASPNSLRQEMKDAAVLSRDRE